MTNTELTLHREKLLALRASLLGDITHMEHDSLKDHAKTISIPTDREELGSDNADQELTLTLLEATRTFSTRSRRHSSGSTATAMAAARNAANKSPRPAWTPSRMPQSACDARQTHKANSESKDRTGL